MPTCSFCKNGYEFPKGLTFVLKDGTLKYFCSSKCRKNSKMGRDNRKVKWVRKQKTEESKKKASI
jgi:large subunit ribosomal protein L24e